MGMPNFPARGCSPLHRTRAVAGAARRGVPVCPVGVACAVRAALPCGAAERSGQLAGYAVAWEWETDVSKS